VSRKKPIPDQNRSGGRLHSPSFHCVFIILIREKTGHSIKSSYLCKILLPVKGTSPSGNGTALRPLLFTQFPGLHRSFAPGRSRPTGKTALFFAWHRLSAHEKRRKKTARGRKEGAGDGSGQACPGKRAGASRPFLRSCSRRKLRRLSMGKEIRRFRVRRAAYEPGSFFLLPCCGAELPGAIGWGALATCRPSSSKICRMLRLISCLISK